MGNEMLKFKASRGIAAFSAELVWSISQVRGLASATKMAALGHTLQQKTSAVAADRERQERPEGVKEESLLEPSEAEDATGEEAKATVGTGESTHMGAGVPAVAVGTASIATTIVKEQVPSVGPEASAPLSTLSADAAASVAPAQTAEQVTLELLQCKGATLNSHIQPNGAVFVYESAMYVTFK